MTTAAAGVLAISGGLVALSAPAAQAVPSLPTNCVQPTVGGEVTCTFGYTGGEQSFSVPDGVTSVNVKAWGGHGGTPSTTAPSRATRRAVGVDWSPGPSG